MNASTLNLLSIISFVAAGLFLVLAVILFIYFKIPGVISDLSGRNARKSIAKTRAYNEKAQAKGHAPDALNLKRGMVTETVEHIAPSAPPAPAKTKRMAPQPQSYAPAAETVVLSQNQGGMVNPETTLLDTNNAQANTFDTEETGLLSSDGDTVLLAAPAVRGAGKVLTMIDNEMLIHTDEVI